MPTLTAPLPISAGPGDDTQQALVRARELVANGWCQGAYAVDTHGQGVSPGDTTAVRFCLLGAIERSAREIGQEIRMLCTQEAAEAALEEQLIRCYARPTDSPTLDEWNDQQSRRQSEVLALFDRAIAACT